MRDNPLTLCACARRIAVFTLAAWLDDVSLIARVQEVAAKLLTNIQGAAHADGDLEWLAARTERYSGSDLRALCHEAAMAPLREQGAGIASVTAAALRPVQRRDFEAALGVMRPSVSGEQMEGLEAWAREYGTRA